MARLVPRNWWSGSRDERESNALTHRASDNMLLNMLYSLNNLNPYRLYSATQCHHHHYQVLPDISPPLEILISILVSLFFFWFIFHESIRVPLRKKVCAYVDTYRKLYGSTAVLLHVPVVRCVSLCCACHCRGCNRRRSHLFFLWTLEQLVHCRRFFSIRGQQTGLGAASERERKGPYRFV